MIKKPILLVGNFLSSTKGNYNVCEDLATRLALVGWPVITTSKRQQRVLRFGDMVSTSWRRRAEYDVALVDVYSGLAFLWAEATCWVLRRAQKPYILTLRGGNLPGFAKRWPSRVTRLLQSADVVTVPSEFLRDLMAPYRKDLRLHLNPIDLQLYPFKQRVHPRPNLIWLRAFHSCYNPKLAAEVVALLTRSNPDVNLVMYGHDKGDGSLQAMQQLALTLRISGVIRTPGGIAKAKVSEALSTGDIFLNTTKIDNTPISVLEAMASGLCVVSTNVGGMPYLVEHDRDGLLVPPDDAPAMAAAVQRILTEPGLAARLSTHAREKAEQFDWARIMPRWEELLAAVPRY